MTHSEKEAKKLTSVSPWYRGEWYGEIHTLDGASTRDFDLEDLDEVLFSGQNGDGSSGEVAGIARLKDGRFVTWETFYDVTGDGFAADAYGGNADILVSRTLKNAAMLGLTPEGRKLVSYVKNKPKDKYLDYPPNRTNPRRRGRH